MSQFTKPGIVLDAGDNPLLKNADRAVFTFSMHNLAEMCFNDVYRGAKFKRTEENEAKVELCIQKYM